MIKVLHLINYPGRGGSERYILSLAEKLHNRECLFYLGYSMDGPMLDQARALGIQTLNIPMSRPYDLRAARMLRELCDELSVDVIHTHFLRENYISIFSKMMGNKAALINTRHLLNNYGVLLKAAGRFFSLFVNRTIAVSNAVKERMVAEGTDPRLIEVIYNGVDTEYWKGRRNYKVRDEMGLDRDDFVVISTARFSEEKGHLFFLEAIKVLKKNTSLNDDKAARIKFVLVGEGELLEECRSMARMLGVDEDVVFTGYRSDIRNMLHGSDLFISHSRSEALGISILEALSSGLPVIATNSGGPTEIISEQNGCGLIVEYGDTEGLAAAILRFASDKKFYKACRDNAGSTVNEKFNLDKTALDTYNLYKIAGKRTSYDNG